MLARLAIIDSLYRVEYQNDAVFNS